MRYNPENPDEIMDEYEVGLIEWADQCKLPNTRPDAVRRSLESPHAELLKKGYLRNVTLTGRGREQRLHYEFAPEFTPVSPALLHRLRLHGVADGVSRQLARQYTTSVLLARIDQFERLMKIGALQVKKTAAHALVHLIKHADQYPDAGAARPGQRRTVTVAEPRKGGSNLVSGQGAEESPATDWKTQLSEMSAEEVAAFVVKRIALLYARKFRVTELDVLREGLVRGQVQAVALLEEAYERLASLDAQGFVDDLKVRVSTLGSLEAPS